MKVELLLDDHGFVSAVRSGWKSGCIPPQEENTYEIRRDEFIPLVTFLAGRLVKKGTKEKHDVCFGENMWLEAMSGGDDTINIEELLSGVL